MVLAIVERNRLASNPRDEDDNKDGTGPSTACTALVQRGSCVNVNVGRKPSPVLWTTRPSRPFKLMYIQRREVVFPAWTDQGGRRDAVVQHVVPCAQYQEDIKM